MFKCLIVKNSNYFSDIFRKNKNISLLTSVVKMSSSSNNDKSPSPPKKDEADDKKDKKPSSDNESELDIDSLMNLFKMIGLKGKPKKREKVLRELDLENFAEHLKKSKKIIFMNGAGISTAAGIPDFRSPKTGLYSNLAKYDLPDPHLIFELNFFMQNPKPFFTLSKELMPKNYKPTKAHYFQRLLVDKGIVHKIYTQNIDGLESIARVPDNKVVYAHGSFKTGHCLACRKEYSFEWMKKNIHEKEFMKCESEECEKSSKREALKVVKPDIVFFGEQMPEEFHNFPSDFSECDCLVVIGTSLKVYPFSSLVDYVKDDCPRLLINRELVGDWQTYEDEASANYRDVSFQGNCDDGCDKLAELCGWKDDLEKLIKDEDEKTSNPTA